MLARGEDGALAVMVDGQEELVFRDIENIEFDWGFTTEQHNFVGRDRPVTTEANGPCQITVRLKPGSPGFDRLVELRRARATSLATRSNIQFDMTSTVNFGGAGRARWAFPDLKIGSASGTVPGRTQHVTNSMTFICDDPRKLP